MKNLTTKLIQLIAFWQGIQFASPKRTDLRKNYISISVANQIQFARALQRGNIRSKYQKRFCMVSGLLSQKSSHRDPWSLMPIFTNNTFVPIVLWNIGHLQSPIFYNINDCFPCHFVTLSTPNKGEEECFQFVKKRFICEWLITCILAKILKSL